MIVKETLILKKIDLKGMYGLQRVRGSIPFPSFGHFWTISRNRLKSLYKMARELVLPYSNNCSLFEGGHNAIQNIILDFQGFD